MTKTFFTQWNERKIKNHLLNFFFSNHCFLLQQKQKISNHCNMQHSSLRFWFKETIWYEYLCNRKLLNIFFQIVTTSFSIESSLESVRKVRFREYFLHLHAANLTPTQREIKGTQRSLQICIICYVLQEYKNTMRIPHMACLVYAENMQFTSQNPLFQSFPLKKGGGVPIIKFQSQAPEK